MHEIRIILGNVAAQSEPTIPEFVPRHPAEAEITRSLAVIRKDLSAHRGELSPMLLKTRQHRIIALIQHRTQYLWTLPAHARCPVQIHCAALSRHRKRSDRAPATNTSFFMKTFLCSEEHPDLTTKLKTELAGIANWAIEGLRDLRARNGNFYIVKRAAKAKSDLRDTQSTALRFANDCLDITGDRNDVVPLKMAFLAYRLWADNVEMLAASKLRDKTGFKDDMMTALRKLKLRFVEDPQLRWHDPHLVKKGKGEQINHRFTGVRLKLEAHPDAESIKQDREDAKEDDSETRQ